MKICIPERLCSHTRIVISKKEFNSIKMQLALGLTEITIHRKTLSQSEYLRSACILRYSTFPDYHVTYISDWPELTLRFTLK